jgi:DNA repair protein RecN (Recombination protein N)
MLLSLKVQNYALIDELAVEFTSGLNIITGETGAGKSILLGALGLILGKRADTGVLRAEDRKCVVEAEFNISKYNLQDQFRENDIDFDTHAVFRREILSSGKSRAFINDTPVNLNVLQDLALQLVDIHSQHHNLLLNQQSYIVEIIDAFTKSDECLADYKLLFTRYKEKEKEYNKRCDAFNAVKTEFDFLSHQFNELTSANLRAEEMPLLEQELNQLENAEDIKLGLHEAENILFADDAGALDLLNSAYLRLGKVGAIYATAEGFSRRIENLVIELKDMQKELVKSFEGLEFDPEKQLKIKDRLDLLNSLLQKYRKHSLTELIEFRNNLDQKISVAVDGEFELNQLKMELEELLLKLKQKAKELSDKRTSGFGKFEMRVESMLQDMGMQYAKVAFENQIQELGPSGIDAFTMLFTANKNHPLLDISKTASGGELSRLMLSIKALVSDSRKMPTLILDEIDSGVSGEIADKVGNIIKQMCNGTQIINITHLPQVASKGATHYLVYKDHGQTITRTLIKKLNDKERLYEIAKMLSGEELSEAAMENARILLGM